MHTELARALHEGSGSQGGATVGSSFRDGFLFLQGVGLPIDARGLLVEAAARPTGPWVARPRSHVGSFPIGVYCQVEYTANGPPSALRTVAQSFVMTAESHCVRLNYSLNCKLVADVTSISRRLSCVGRPRWPQRTGHRLSFIRRRWAGLARSGGLQSTSPISAVVSTQCPTIGRRRRISRCGRAQLRARFYHYAQQAICRVHGGWQSLA